MHTVTDRDSVLQRHLEKEHAHSSFAEYIKEVVYGGIDGIVTTFAVVAGFSGASLAQETATQLSFLVVLLFGLANLLADATAMGLGNFLSIRSEKDVYTSARTKEQREVKENTDLEYQETVTILMQKGYTETDATAMADLYRKNEDYWVDFMMSHELEMPDPRGENPIISGLVTFFSFLFFGAIPLLPFLVATEATAGVVFKYSIAGTFTALILLSLLKWRIVGHSIWKSLFEVVIVGAVAASVAFFVGSLFEI